MDWDSGLMDWGVSVRRPEARTRAVVYIPSRDYIVGDERESYRF